MKKLKTVRLYRTGSWLLFSPYWTVLRSFAGLFSGLQSPYSDQTMFICQIRGPDRL